MSIAVRNLTKYYGEQAAIHDISFDVKSGEILGFLGPNGAGKTTTMKILTCYMPPNSGTVEVEGLDIFERSVEVRRKIGYLPEMNPLYLDMNVLDYLEYSAQLHGLRGGAVTQRLKEMVHVCGLEDVRHKDIGEMSKGFRQRVGLAQAMIHDPEVLILDEPTSGLDPNQIVEIRNLIKQLGRAKTVILSTHILSEVQATCDRVLIINEGKIVADGSPGQLQRDFHGADALRLELRTGALRPVEDILPRLRSIPQVSGVRILAQDGSTGSYEMQTEKGHDAREAVFHLAVAEGWVILEMHRRVTTLEEVFHKLTTSES
ncbi:MAG: transporter [Bacteroidetes bacterium]|nr:transporter [Bacteroidota bacterium]